MSSMSYAFRLGRTHAKTFLADLGSLRSELDEHIFIEQEDAWPLCGPYSWYCYLQGARSVLGEERVIGGRRLDATPLDIQPLRG